MCTKFVGWVPLQYNPQHGEATGRLSADESTPPIAAFYRVGFECAKQGPTDPAKPSVRRDVVQFGLFRVRDRTHTKKGAALDCYAQRFARLSDLLGDDFGGLVALRCTDLWLGGGRLLLVDQPSSGRGLLPSATCSESRSSTRAGDSGRAAAAGQGVAGSGYASAADGACGRGAEFPARQVHRTWAVFVLAKRKLQR